MLEKPKAPKKKPRPSDAADREAIRTALDENILVEAAAGTGKTTSLVDRMVASIARGRATIDQLSAVTFTIKAAAQLHQRFQVALEKAAREESHPDRRRLLDEARRGIQACFIGTIHAFCARLIRERPVEAGVDPGFEEMDESADLAAREEAWGRWTERLFLEADPLLTRLSSVGVDLGDLREAYNLLCENRDVEPASEPETPPPDLSAAREAVDILLPRAACVLRPDTPEKGWDRFQGPLREAIRLSQVLDISHDAAFVQVLSVLDRAKKPTWNRWLARGPAEALWNDFEGVREEVLRPALQLWREYLHPIVIETVSAAAREYDSWRRREGKLNFQDLLILARNLLRDHPAARRAFQRRFTPLLVDEFQDTDPIQAEVVLYLTGNETDERDWRRLTPRPGSLFVVGDPKQSIYRFRRADIETYGRVRDTIVRTGGRVLRLSRNFRSTEEICDWANSVFERIFPPEPAAGAPPAPPEQAFHVPLVPAGGETDPRSEAVRLEIAATGLSTPEEVARADADRIADEVAAGVADGSSPGDFLLLSRWRRRLPIYARALEARGIPYEISGGGAFRDSEELAALLAILQALADPDDPIPLVAALRGPIFGIDDRALFLFRRAGGRFALRAALPDGVDPRIARAWELLRDCERFAAELPPGAAISRVGERLGWTAAVGAEELGDTRAGNLLKASAAARDFSRRGDSFSAVVRRLTEMTREGDAEEMTTHPGRSDAVRLMTVHRAKGLEARVVFLADPADDVPKPPLLWIDRRVDPPQGHFLVRRSWGEFGGAEIARPRGWDGMCAREDRFVRAEEERLLYVAATRARSRLIASIKRQQNADASVKWTGRWARLRKDLPRELPPTATSTTPSPVSAAAADPESALAASRALRLERLEEASRPTAAALSVTRLAHPEGVDRPFASGTGRGMSWGSVLHRLLEASMRDPALDLRAYGANVLAEEDRPPTDLEEAVAAVDAVRRSDLWKRALAAKRCLVEVPFALSVPSADLGVAGGPSETLLSGAIDLVFEEEDGWSLVDYKSDTVVGNFDALVRFYTPQIEHYRRVWRDVTRRPTRAGLFFLDGGREVWLEG